MIDYDFYRGQYGSNVVPEQEFMLFAREAQAQLDRYKRIYQVTAPQEDSEKLAVCAMLDALYYYSQAQNGELTASVKIGSVSSSGVQTAQPDTSPAAQEKELYRCARLYLDIYRGVD